jgi:hypothetical protein
VPSQVRTAYETLINPVLREEYDRNLKTQQTGVWSLISEPLELLKSCYQPQCTPIQSYQKTIQSDGSTTHVAEYYNDKVFDQSYDIVNGKKIMRRMSKDPELKGHSKTRLKKDLAKLLLKRESIDRAIERIKLELGQN